MEVLGEGGGEEEERRYCCIGPRCDPSILPFEPFLITAFRGGQVYKHDFRRTFDHPGSAFRVYSSNAPLQGHGENI